VATAEEQLKPEVARAVEVATASVEADKAVIGRCAGTPPREPPPPGPARTASSSLYNSIVSKRGSTD
jgi:hypothetical protein